MKFILFAAIFLLTPLFLSAQAGAIRGHVYDEETGEPIAFATIRLDGTAYAANTDWDGFFSLTGIPPGNYRLVASYLGYDSVGVDIGVAPQSIGYQRLLMKASIIELTTVDVSGRREQARSEVQVSRIGVTPKSIRSLPSTGGESDLVQYLTVLPGVITSGDQGGQLYIRGGSPVQNKILLDGMTIYNPFHSIGFFSVFETEAIQKADVLTGGFNADYGGRISAVVDIQTREGNKTRYSGLVSASPFQSKILLEGPIRKWREDSAGSSSFLLTAKHSYLDQTSKTLYQYAVDTTFFSFATADTSSLGKKTGLPYQYTDLYGKVSLFAGKGSQLNLFGFRSTDRFDVAGLVRLGWDAYGGGANFSLVPVNSNTIIKGTIALTDYAIELEEPDGGPRTSGIDSYTAALNFTYFGKRSQLDYGFEFNGFNTDFRFQNLVGVSIEQKDFTTELAGYAKYRQQLDRLILEPGIRLQFYASQSVFSLEPRLGLKFLAGDKLRLKMAGGFYSQNLISTVNDLDVVNFFVGFLAGPEETFFKPGTTDPVDHRLQKSIHGIGGLEIDISPNLEWNIEGYYKRFTQLIQVNRNKLSGLDPDFSTETGDAYGLDLAWRYENRRTYLWVTYSLAFVQRDDGFQEYPTVFDRRHNVNVFGSYLFGKKQEWELGFRWNYGSAFPFTSTQGFYQDIPFDNIVSTNILTGNFDLGTILSDDRNDARLSDFHRLDASLKRTFRFSSHGRVEVDVSITNVYNRDNVFFVDRISNRRVDQLPVLPSLGFTLGF